MIYDLRLNMYDVSIQDRRKLLSGFGVTDKFQHEKL